MKMSQEVKIRRLFHYQNLIWFSYGVSCFEIKSTVIRRILFCIKTFSHFYFIQQILGALTNVILTHDARNVYPAIYCTKTYICFIILSVKLTPLVDEVSTFTNTFLCNEVHKKLIRLERFCFYFFIVWTIIFSSISFINQLVNVINSNDGTAGFDLINYWIPTFTGLSVASLSYIIILSIFNLHLVDGIIIPITLTYGYFVIIIYFIKDAFFQELEHRTSSVRSLRIKWNEINKIRDRIEKQLNVLPFIIFAIIFFNATSVVIVFCNETHRLKDTALSFVNLENASIGEEISQTKYIIYWAFEFGIGIPVLVIPFLINWIDDQIDEKFKSIRNDFIRNDTTGRGSFDHYQMEKLIAEMQPSLKLHLTGWSMFELNKMLVLGFVSSLLTYSVLFLQLSES